MANVPLKSFEDLVQRLQEEKLPFRQLPEEKTVSLPTKLGDEDGILHIRWEPTPGVLQFIQTLPIELENDSNEGEILKAITRINVQLAVLGFTYNFETRGFAFRTHVFLAEGDGILPGMVGALISTCAQTTTRYLPELRTAAFGETTDAGLQMNTTLQ